MSETVGTNKSGLLLGLIIGGAVGAITSLLLAPKSGLELREDLSNTYRTLNDKTSQLASAVGQKTQEVASTISEKTQDIASSVSDHAADIVDKAKESKQLVAESLQAAKDNFQNDPSN
ncbi:YtxH domain-containing protein [Paenibacillus sp. N3.4]|uniref:YtxH domain-containing protein n=1 Tax=Paenibacillus sp. N3.4 TaxID=2603222 RepID=UPI0011C8B8FF|nr:YtxH domain-containing protein [Paenibacillus sp. N3.4]TXK74847.1 YtxH domain-containing protein [Paenibacillus sp. N3.4]